MQSENNLHSNLAKKIFAVFLLFVFTLSLQTIKTGTFDIFHLFIPNAYLSYHGKIGSFSPEWILSPKIMSIFIALSESISSMFNIPPSQKYETLQMVQITSISAAISLAMFFMTKNTVKITPIKFIFIALLPFIVTTPSNITNFYANYTFAPFFVSSLLIIFIIKSYNYPKIYNLALSGIILGVLVNIRISSMVMIIAPLALLIKPKEEINLQKDLKNILTIYLFFAISLMANNHYIEIIKKSLNLAINHPGFSHIALLNYLLDIAIAIPVIIVMLLPFIFEYFVKFNNQKTKNFVVITLIIISLITLFIIHQSPISNYLILSSRPKYTYPFTGFEALKNIYTFTYIAISYIVIIFGVIKSYKKDKKTSLFLIVLTILSSLTIVASIAGTNLGFSPFSIFSVFLYLTAILSAFMMYDNSTCQRKNIKFYLISISILIIVLFFSKIISQGLSRRTLPPMPNLIKSQYIKEKTFVSPGSYLYTESLKPNSGSSVYSAASPEVLIKEIINKNPKLCKENKVFMINLGSGSKDPKINVKKICNKHYETIFKEGWVLYKLKN